MAKRIEYRNGDLIREIKFIKELESERKPCGDLTRFALFECPYCHNQFTQRISDIRSRKTISCGCRKTKGFNTKHGLRYTKYYKEWQNIKNRCLNPNTKQFKDYGGRGILICDEWIGDFMTFYNYIITLEGHELIGHRNDQLTIDRINNNGNYEPGNLKFSTRKEQAHNSRRYAA
jgi:hypothetical protein